MTPSLSDHHILHAVPVYLPDKPLHILEVFAGLLQMNIHHLQTESFQNVWQRGWRMLHKITADQFESPAFAAEKHAPKWPDNPFSQLERLFVEFCDDNFRM